MVIFEAKNGDMLAFSLTKLELLELDYLYPGGFKTHVFKVVMTENILSMIDIYKDILVKAYGILFDEDGERMVIKTAVFTNAFKNSHQLSEVFEAISRNQQLMDRFIKGIVSENTILIRKKR